MTTISETAGGGVLYELCALTRRYGQDGTAVDALRSLDLAIPGGEFVIIAGPSGSGKSTLLQLLGGLDRASSGELLLDGVDLGRLDDNRLADLRHSTIGFVFQQFNLIPTLTAAQNVEIALAPRHAPAADRLHRVSELLAQVGLEHRSRHLPSQLSGGEQQRAAIARARQPTTHPPRRRADRESRHRHRQRDPCPSAQRRDGRRQDAHPRHTRPRRRRAGDDPAPHARRPNRARSTRSRPNEAGNERHR